MVKVFDENKIDQYLEAINNTICLFGYMAVPMGRERSCTSFFIYKSGTRQRSQTLKNLICAVMSSEYIDWGPNKYLEGSNFHKALVEAIERVK